MDMDMRGQVRRITIDHRVAGIWNLATNNSSRDMALVEVGDTSSNKIRSSNLVINPLMAIHTVEVVVHITRVSKDTASRTGAMVKVLLHQDHLVGDPLPRSRIHGVSSLLRQISILRSRVEDMVGVTAVDMEGVDIS
jgi:hypothetical protein